jgi:hypothetical protein
MKEGNKEGEGRSRKVKEGRCKRREKDVKQGREEGTKVMEGRKEGREMKVTERRKMR